MQASKSIMDEIEEDEIEDCEYSPQQPVDLAQQSRVRVSVRLDDAS